MFVNLSRSDMQEILDILDAIIHKESLSELDVELIRSKVAAELKPRMNPYSLDLDVDAEPPG